MDLVNSIYELRKSDYKTLLDEGVVQFIGHCLSNIQNTCSQNYQDIWVLYQTKYKQNGFFVEFGATDGVDISNTYLLEKDYGWTGILAEPNPFWHDKLKSNRSKCIVVTDCVYSESNQKLSFNMTNAADLATIDKYSNRDEHANTRKNGTLIEVNTVSLIDMLKNNKAPNAIDYLSIDTEGSEYDILSAFFAENKDYDIRNITVEHNFVEAERNKIFELLQSQGYKRVMPHVSRWDDFYTKEK
jgi:FkbM family methyltransferase